MSVNVVVCVRGLVGSGKTTVINVIKNSLKKEGFTVSQTREQRTLETIDVTKKG